MLSRNVIDVWTSSLDCSEGCLLEYERSLSAEELRRSDAFRSPQLRSAFLASRGALRQLLANYLGCGAREIEIAQTNLGKPFLPDSELYFSVSHSGQALVFIFGRGMKVGIDVEPIRAFDDLLAVSTQFFAHSEIEVLRQAPAEMQPSLFFQIWTLKEAFIKATGQGLQRPLDSFAVQLNPEPRLVLFGSQPGASTWFLRSFFPADGYVGGLISEWRPATIRWRTLTHGHAGGCDALSNDAPAETSCSEQKNNDDGDKEGGQNPL